MRRFPVLGILAFLAAGSANATMIISATFNDAQFASDGYSASDIANIHSAFSVAAASFTDHFTDNIHININVTSSAAVGLGQSTTNLIGFLTYNQVQAALSADAKTADDVSTVANMMVTDPTGSNKFIVSRAQAKALGLIADDLINDGTFTFASNKPYTFDPLDRGVAGKFDFIGVAQHEIAEILGKIVILGSIQGGYELADLFRYSAAGVHSVSPLATGVYFSVDNGITNLVGFNSNGAGDLGDYDGANPSDAFNAFTGAGQAHALSVAGLKHMDVLGYDALVVADVPEPSSFALLGLGLLTAGPFALLRRKRTAALNVLA